MPSTAPSDCLRFPQPARTSEVPPTRLPAIPALSAGLPVLGNRAFMRAWAARRARLAPGAVLPRR